MLLLHTYFLSLVQVSVNMSYAVDVQFRGWNNFKKTELSNIGSEIFCMTTTQFKKKISKDKPLSCLLKKE